jgi:hypothetical protein
VLQGNQSPALTERDYKALVIAEYLEKFGTIGNRVITPQMYSLYIEALEDIELRKLRKGLVECLQSCTKFPWPGDIRDYCEDEV